MMSGMSRTDASAEGGRELGGETGREIIPIADRTKLERTVPDTVNPAENVERAVDT
jgi:hypothetical protein